MNHRPLLLSITALAGAASFGAWSGWRAERQIRPRFVTIMEERSPSAAPASRTGAIKEKWETLVSAPSPYRLPHSGTHMALLREAARGLSTADLAALIVSGVGDPAPRESSLKSMAVLIGEYSERDPAAAVALLFEYNALERFGGNFHLWGERDAAAALAWLDAHPGNPGDRWQVLEGMGENDPQGAFELMRTSPARDGMSGFPRLFETWVQRDPAAAVAAWAANQDWRACSGSTWLPALERASPAQREELLAAFKALKDPNLRAKGLIAIAGHKVLTEPEEAVKLAENSGLPARQQWEMRRGVLAAWRQRESNAAADWYWKSTPAEQSADAMETLMNVWLAPGIAAGEGCLEWVQRQPAGSLPAETPQLYVQAAFARDPGSALRDWLVLAPRDSSEAASALGRYLATTPQGALLPVLLEEAGFPAQMKATVLGAAGHNLPRDLRKF
ncbi:MAG: hypothetical protein JWM59_320 [Verrucomicrobiales bacterium]|nr:hypothetical protein [Verrucomicrobiales bacterium]